jgi:hypothetical protein
MRLPRRQVDELLRCALEALLMDDVINRAKFKAAFESVVAREGFQSRAFYAADDISALISRQAKPRAKRKSPAKK